MRSNRIPFTDICQLVAVSNLRDADGYSTVRETARQVFCSIIAGVSRAEMYEALKAGIKLSATAEIWEDDYNHESQLEHDGVRYKIIRCYPTGNGTLELALEEVVH